MLQTKTKENDKIKVKVKCSKCNAEQNGKPFWNYYPIVGDEQKHIQLCPACDKIWIAMVKSIASYRESRVKEFWNAGS